MTIKVSPSIAAGDLLNLEKEIKKLEQSGADAIHVDVMDGHYVPHLTIGVPILAAIRKATTMPLDVHIMITNTDETFYNYLEAGADTLTIHWETTKHHHRVLSAIKAEGKKAGIAINPGTGWEEIKYLLPFIDQVTIMTVNPGFSRQKHIKEMHAKIKELSEYCLQKGFSINIQVDGGVSPENSKTLEKLGVTDVVAGGAVMGKEDYKQAINSLKK